MADISAKDLKNFALGYHYGRKLPTSRAGDGDCTLERFQKEAQEVNAMAPEDLPRAALMLEQGSYRHIKVMERLASSGGFVTIPKDVAVCTFEVFRARFAQLQPPNPGFLQKAP